MGYWRAIVAGGDVGGRATDVGQIAASIYSKVHEIFPGGLPADVRDKLFDMSQRLDGAEEAIRAFAQFMIDKGLDDDE